MSLRIVIVGGGPGGSTAGTLLARQGHAVTILEKTKFPRFHLGESLLPHTLRILGELGFRDEMDARFLVKRGAQFFDNTGTARMPHSRFGFEGAFDPTYASSFQVPRDEFDLMLLDGARKAGCDVREEWTVVAPLRDGESANGRIVGVSAKDANGGVHALPADLVIDASGRDAMFARGGASTTSKIDGLDGTSIYSHWDGIPRDEGDRAGDIRMVLFDGGWIWIIPFKDGRTSIGVVLARDGMRARWAESKLPPRETLQRMYKDVLAEMPAAHELTKGGTQLWPAEAAADFSYRVGKLHGPGWLSVGDAAGFIDPLFSTGVHMAMTSASFVSQVIAEASAAGEVAPNDVTGDAFTARLEAWEKRVRGGAELFVSAVTAFYRGKLQPYLFAEEQRTVLRRSITSMLAGDVFDDDTRWKRDMRVRLGAL